MQQPRTHTCNAGQQARGRQQQQPPHRVWCAGTISAEADALCFCVWPYVYARRRELRTATSQLPDVAAQLTLQLGQRNTVSAYARGALGLLRQRQVSGPA
eukprot:COSAG05_NODE_2047_length_3643_cov_3.595655_4_plen_100_part_00